MIIPMFVGWIPLNAILTRAPIWFHPRATVSGQVLEAGGVRALDIGAGTGLFGAQWVFELQRGSIIKKYKDIIHKLCLVDDCYIWLYHFMGIWFHIIYIYVYTHTNIYIYIMNKFVSVSILLGDEPGKLGACHEVSALKKGYRFVLANGAFAKKRSDHVDIGKMTIKI